MKTNPAPFAGERINTDSAYIVFRQGVKPADREAKSTASAFLHVNSGFLAALENVPFQDFRVEKQMEVGGVDVDIGQDGAPG
jgi:hypothetical protein